MFTISSQKKFKQLKDAVDTTNSDQIPLIAHNIANLLIKAFERKNPYDFACIILDYIEFAKYSFATKHYEQLAMVFNLSSKATLSLISIIENEQFCLFPAIIFNQCDLRKQCQELKFDINYILEFKKKVFEYLKKHLAQYKEIDIDQLLYNNFLNALVPYYLELNLNRRYVKDVLAFIVEQTIFTNKPQELATAINHTIQNIDFLKLIDLYEIFGINVHVVNKLLLLFSSKNSLLLEIAWNNGFSGTYMEEFKKSIRTQIKSHDGYQRFILDPNRNFSSILNELQEKIANVNNDDIDNQDVVAFILKINNLFATAFEYCIKAMLELNPIKFIDLINQFIECIFPNNNVIVSSYIVEILFDLDIEDEDFDIIYQLLNDHAHKQEDRKLILSWYLINSKIMNLSMIAEHNAISFDQYREFKIQSYATLCKSFNKDNSYLEDNNKLNLHNLLKDAYELKDSKKYYHLINNQVKHTIVSLHTANQHVEIIKLLRTKGSIEIIQVFDALNSKNDIEINKAIVDSTLKKICLYNKSLNSLSSFKSKKPSNYLWNKSTSKSNYICDLEEFRVAIYKEFPDHNKDKVKKLELLDPSFLYDYPWSNLEKNDLEINKLQYSGFDNVIDEYKKYITELSITNFNIINKYKGIRRKLFDYAFLSNNYKKCAKLIELDIFCLETAYKENVQAKAYASLSFDYEEISLLNFLFNKKDQQLLKLFLLQHLDFSCNGFTFETNSKSALDFKIKVFSELQLNRYKPSFLEFEEISLIEILSIAKYNDDQIKMQPAIINLLSSYALYCDRNNQHKDIWIKGIKKNINNIPNDERIKKILPLCLQNFILNCNLIEENLFYFKICANYLYPNDTIRRDNLSPSDIKAIKEQFGLANYFSKTKLTQLLDLLKNAIVKQDFTNAVIIILTIETIFDDSLEELNSKKFADAAAIFIKNIISLKNLIKTDLINKRIYTSEEINLIPFIYNKDQNYLEDNHILSILIVRKIYNQLDGLKKPKFDFNELCQFLISVRENMQNNYIGNLEAAHSQSLFDPKIALTKDLTQELYLIKIISAKAREVLEYAWLVKDKVKFTATVKGITKLLFTFYKNRKIKPILIFLNFFNQSELYVFFRYLEIDHENAAKRWLINHFIDRCMYYIKNNIMLYKFIANSLEDLENDQFKQDCYDALGIELADSIDPRIEKITNLDQNQIDLLFTSIRTLANSNKVNIKKYEQLITILAKKYYIVSKSQFNPTDQDTARYQELHQIMQAIWHCHIAGHIFSIVTENIKINGFSLAWEGAYESIISEYLRKMHLQILQKPTYSTNIGAIDIKLDLIEAMENGISSNQEDVHKWLKSRLSTEQIIAIDISLYEDDSENNKHAVSAVFEKIGEHDLVLFADRGVELQSFSGIKIFKITNNNDKKEILEKLIGIENSNYNYRSTSTAYAKEIQISSSTYKNLQKKLKLQDLGCIPMFMQLMGNCTFSSSAEPMHLGISFLSFLKSILQKKPHLMFQEAFNLAEESCLELHNYMMDQIYSQTLTNLVNFFEKSTMLQIPKELFSHIHIINIYKIKNPLIMSIFNRSEILKVISEEDKLDAYEDYVNYFNIAINNAINYQILIARKEKITQQQLQQYGMHLTTAFLNDNLEQEKFYSLSECISKSLIFGDKKISPLMLWEFDRPLLEKANIQEKMEKDVDFEVNPYMSKPYLPFI